MPAIDDKDAAGNPQPKRRSDKRSKQEIVEEVRIDRQDVNWSEGGIPDFIGRLPLRISQGGNANDLSVQINVAMLPPVEDFRGYEAAAPGAAQYIMKAADEQRHHRFAIEDLLVKGSERRRTAGQLLSAMLSMTGLIGAILLGLFGNGWVAGVLAVVAVGGPLAAQTLAGRLGKADGADPRNPREPSRPDRNPGDKPERPT